VNLADPSGFGPGYGGSGYGDGGDGFTGDGWPGNSGGFGGDGPGDDDMAVIREYEQRSKLFMDAGNVMVSAGMLATAGAGLFDGAAGAAEGAAEEAEAAAADTGADYAGTASGEAIPTSQSALEKGFQDAGFTSEPARGDGTIYTAPNGMQYRVMNPSGGQPGRVITYGPSGDVRLPDGSVMPSGNIDKSTSRYLSHFYLKP
jgi:hypothetical protein